MSGRIKAVPTKEDINRMYPLALEALEEIQPAKVKNIVQYIEQRSPTEEKHVDLPSVVEEVLTLAILKKAVEKCSQDDKYQLSNGVTVAHRHSIKASQPARNHRSDCPKLAHSPNCPERAKLEHTSSCPERAKLEHTPSCPERARLEHRSSCPERVKAEHRPSCPERVKAEHRPSCPERAKQVHSPNCPEMLKTKKTQRPVQQKGRLPRCPQKRLKMANEHRNRMKKAKYSKHSVNEEECDCDEEDFDEEDDSDYDSDDDDDDDDDDDYKCKSKLKTQKSRKGDHKCKWQDRK